MFDYCQTALRRTNAILIAAAMCAYVGCKSDQPDEPPLPALGEETIPDNESFFAEQTTEIIKKALKARAADTGDRTIRRDAHAKAHGCVHARFEVHSDIPGALQTDVFTPGKSFDAWVRFSNSGGGVADDNVGDGRGLAIKLLGVPGDKLLEGERNAPTQDFLMINHPAFFVPDAPAYLNFASHDSRNNPVGYFLSFGKRTPVQLRGLNVARQILTKKVNNPLIPTYNSMTPFLHGDTPAVKYRARPCDNTHGGTLGDGGPDTLRVALQKSLAQAPACFVFEVQPQTDVRRMPIEDATVAWPEAESAFVPLATLHIPQQAFLSPKQVAYCEAMSFTPWHSIAAHRPLGSLNRIRNVVYRTIRDFRHSENGTSFTEPTTLTDFNPTPEPSAPSEPGGGDGQAEPAAAQKSQ